MPVTSSKSTLKPDVSFFDMTNSSTKPDMSTIPSPWGVSYDSQSSGFVRHETGRKVEGYGETPIGRLCREVNKPG